MQVAPAPDSARSNFSISAVKIRYNVFWRSEKTLQCLSSFVSLCAYYTGKFCIEASLNYSDSRIYAYYSFVTLSVQGASQILACRRPAAIKSGNDPEQLWCSGDIVLIIIIWLWSLHHLDSQICEWHRLMSFWHSFKCSSIHSFTSIRFLMTDDYGFLLQDEDYAIKADVESVEPRERSTRTLQSQDSQEENKADSINKDAAKAHPPSVGPADSAADLYFRAETESFDAPEGRRYFAFYPSSHMFHKRNTGKVIWRCPADTWGFMCWLRSKQLW